MGDFFASKLLVAHLPKTGGTSLSNCLYQLFASRNRSSTLLGLERLSPEQQLLVPCLNQVPYDLEYSYLVGGINQVCLPDWAAACLEKSSLVSGHFHSSIDYLRAFSDCLSGSLSTNSLDVIITHRTNQASWLKSVLKFTLIEASKACLSGKWDLFPVEWVSLSMMMRSPSVKPYQVYPFVVDVLIKSYKSKYFQSQVKYNERALNVFRDSSANCRLYALDSSNINLFIDRLAGQFGFDFSPFSSINATPSVRPIDEKLDAILADLIVELGDYIQFDKTGCEHLEDASASSELISSIGMMLR